MGLLTRQDIVAAQDIKTVDVEVEEWGGSVRVRMMSGAERDQFEQSMVMIGADGKRVPNLANMRSKLVVMCAVDEKGNHLFGPDEVEHLAAKSAAAIERVFMAAQELNALAPREAEAAVKNSAPGPNGASYSASPSPSE
jgi:hypothetical protein